MKRLVCEMCGSTDLIKTEGVFVCQSCGVKYSVEEARKMMVEGPVDVSGSTVKIDTSEKTENLLRLARRAKDENNSAEAKKYYEMALLESPDAWEPSFYSAYYSFWETTVALFPSAVSSFAERAKSTLRMIVEAHDEGYPETLSSIVESANKVYLYAAQYSYDKRQELFQDAFNEAADKAIHNMKYGDNASTPSLSIQASQDKRKQEQENKSVLLDGATNAARMAIKNHVCYLQKQGEDEQCRAAVMSLLKTLDDILKIDAESPAKIKTANEYLDVLFWLQDMLLKYEPASESVAARTLIIKIATIMEPIHKAQGNAFLSSIDFGALTGPVAAMEEAIKGHEKDYEPKRKKARKAALTEIAKKTGVDVNGIEWAAIPERDKSATQKAEKIAFIREREKLLRERLYVDHYCTFILSSDGRMTCTTVTDDQYNIYDNGKSKCKHWNGRVLKGFCVLGGRVYGIAGEGTIVRTEIDRKDKVVFDDKEEYSAMLQWRNVRKLYDDDDRFYGLIYALLEDGTLRVTGNLPEGIQNHGEDRVDGLTGVTDIALSDDRLICLREGGTLTATEYIGEDDTMRPAWEEMSKWTNLVQVISYKDFYIGLRNDGKLVATQPIEDPVSIMAWKEVSRWDNLVYITEYCNRLVAIRNDGRMLVSGAYWLGAENAKETAAFDTIKSWRDIAVFIPDYDAAIGITINGDVVCTGIIHESEYVSPEEFAIERWHNIAAIVRGWRITVGVKRDGSLIACEQIGYEGHGRTNFDGLRMFDNYDELPNKINEALTQYKERIERERMNLTTEQSALNTELANLKGLFSSKRRKEIEARLSEIASELKRFK